MTIAEPGIASIKKNWMNRVVREALEVLASIWAWMLDCSA